MIRVRKIRSVSNQLNRQTSKRQERKNFTFISNGSFEVGRLKKIEKKWPTVKTTKLMGRNIPSYFVCYFFWFRINYWQGKCKPGLRFTKHYYFLCRWHHVAFFIYLKYTFRLMPAWSVDNLECSTTTSKDNYFENRKMVTS